MTTINLIITILLITPIIGVISDYSEGKIKNFFIFPYFFFLLILTIFIDWFYFYKDNLLQLAIVFLFSYFFYINKKWWAWDWKYLIILGLSTVIIWYLKWIEWLIINLFIYSFALFLIYNLIYLIFNISKIKRINFKNINYNLNLKDIIFNISIINIIVLLLFRYLPINYSYLIVFIVLTILIPLISNIKIKYLNIFIIILSLFLTYYYKNYISFLYLSLFFIFFSFLSTLFENIYDTIDIKEIKIIDLKQWNIINKNSADKIYNDSNLKINFEMPLQWLEVYNILDYYKKNKKEDDLLNIYIDIKIWIYIYIWYLITIINSIYLK